mmetsp:Transcript_70615/g.188491  ORF Transcript_70615/g.188491 Transcript_70615/m.188491 type:complete len:89 (-) Transcript_70615:282-548(-)
MQCTMQCQACCEGEDGDLNYTNEMKRRRLESLPSTRSAFAEDDVLVQGGLIQSSAEGFGAAVRRAIYQHIADPSVFSDQFSDRPFETD